MSPQRSLARRDRMLPPSSPELSCPVEEIARWRELPAPQGSPTGVRHCLGHAGRDGGERACARTEWPWHLPLWIRLTCVRRASGGTSKFDIPSGGRGRIHGARQQSNVVASQLRFRPSLSGRVGKPNTASRVSGRRMPGTIRIIDGRESATRLRAIRQIPSRSGRPSRTAGKVRPRIALHTFRRTCSGRVQVGITRKSSRRITSIRASL